MASDYQPAKSAMLPRDTGEDRPGTWLPRELSVPDPTGYSVNEDEDMNGVCVE